MASQEPANEHRGASAWTVLGAMVVVLAAGIGAVALFGYPALIVIALAGTAAALVMLVAISAGR